MIPADPCFRQFPSEQAHLERQEQALFSRHSPLNLQLEFSRRRVCIANRHGQMLPCSRRTGAACFSAYALPLTPAPARATLISNVW